MLRSLRVVVDDSIGGCDVDLLLLSPHYVLTALPAARLSSLSTFILITDLLELRNVRFELSTIC